MQKNPVAEQNHTKVRSWLGNWLVFSLRVAIAFRFTASLFVALLFYLLLPLTREEGFFNLLISSYQRGLVFHLLPDYLFGLWLYFDLKKKRPLASFYAEVLLAVLFSEILTWAIYGLARHGNVTDMILFFLNILPSIAWQAILSTLLAGVVMAVLELKIKLHNRLPNEKIVTSMPSVETT
ncbi:MAG: hypothetical protein AB1489_25970 [Acidobacteriota bacterium]